ncbi:ECF transporter S component [Dendrosporobacter quercicolus]|uniref:ECF transporter S component n=1 Tax=Dendrosporobacter quercicolus TaxID=146817 RepID=UPI003BEEB7D1
MNIKKMIAAALLIALSFIGANLKIMGTIAFDSMPGFLGALLLGPVWGALIGAAGHFLTALFAGFVLTLPVHLEIMGIMAGATAAFGAIYRRLAGKRKGLSGGAALTAAFAAVLINGPAGIAVLSVQLLPVLGKAGLLTLTGVLSAAAALNIAAALLLYHLLLGKLDIAGIDHE